MITIICSTNRNNSVSRIIAGIYKGLLEDRDEQCQIIDMQDLPEDYIASALYENAGKNEDFNPIRNKMLESAKFVFIVPEYNGSFPGVLKVFIDGLKFPHTFTNKKCALVGVSSGVLGGGLALSHLTDIFNYCGMHVLALKPRLARIEANMNDGRITDKLYMELLEQQATDLVAF